MIKKSKITAAVMAAILAVTTIFSPVLAGEFSSPEGITEEFSDGQENQDYKNEISDDMPQIQNDDGEGVSATESETEAETEKVVITDADFKNAANDPSVDIIRIRGDIGNYQLPDGKKIIIESGYTFKITSGRSRVYTTDIEICQNANLSIDSTKQYETIWLKGIIKNKGYIDAPGSGKVYVNYQENLGRTSENLKINILKDGEEEIKVRMPSEVTAGDMIEPKITGMIPGSEKEASEIFTGTWDLNGNTFKKEGISYTVPVNKGESSIKLMLELNDQYGAVKQNIKNPDYVNVQKSTDWSNECKIKKKTLDTIYVDNKKGNDQNTGAEATPVQTFSRALEGINNGGTIILLSDCVTNTVHFNKTITVTGQSNDSSLTLTGNRDWYIDPNITVTLNNISIKTAGIFQYKASGEPGNLVLDTVKNANIEEINGLSAVTLNDSKIACPTIKANKVELKNTELNGRFLTDNLTIEGENTLIYTLNSPGEIVQGITGTGKLKVRLNDIGQKELRGIKVLEVPEAIPEKSNIELDSSYGEQYKLKIRENYMYISEGIAPQIDLYVGNEPRDQEKVDMSSGEDISVNAKMTNYPKAPMSVVGNWSGYKGNTVWSYGDIPVLTVTVTLTDSENHNYHFNQVQDFANLINVYSWKNTNAAINKDVESKATVTVKTGQGISEDGRCCTFTLTYPEVKHRASISISADSLDKDYDGNAVAFPTITTVPEEVKASLKWYQKSGEDWTEIGAAPTDAGEYSVMAYADENENYEGYSERVAFTISKAPNEWTVNPAINNWTSDQTPSQPAGKAKFGTVSFSYSDKKDGTYTETQPTSSGSWYMKATVAGNGNYDSLEKIIPFTIYTPYYPPIVIPTATPTPSPTPTVKPVPDNYPDGSEYLPDGSIKTPNGTIVDSDGKITLPNGVIVKPGNEENKPTLNKENEVITGDGTLVIRPGLSELETGAGWKIFSDGRIVDTDGNVYAMDGSVSDKDGNCVKPAKAMIKNAYTYKNKNQVKVVLYDSCKGAQGYDYVIGKSSNMLQTKEYEKVNKNRKGLKTTFTYMDKGTWYVACHAWVKDANGKKIFGEWSEVKTVVVNAKTPSQPRIISVKTNGSTVTVKFSKTGKATGAEVVLGKELEKLYGEKRPVEYKRYVIEEDEDVTTVTFKNVKKGTYYLSLRKWNRTADNNEKVFGPWAEYVKANVK